MSFLPSLIDWLGFNITRQLWLWATPQSRAVYNFANLEVLLRAPKSQHTPPTVQRPSRRTARASNVYLTNFSGVRDRGSSPQPWALQAHALHWRTLAVPTELPIRVRRTLNWLTPGFLLKENFAKFGAFSIVERLWGYLCVSVRVWRTPPYYTLLYSDERKLRNLEGDPGTYLGPGNDAINIAKLNVGTARWVLLSELTGQTATASWKMGPLICITVSWYTPFRSPPLLSVFSEGSTYKQTITSDPMICIYTFSLV